MNSSSFRRACAFGVLIAALSTLVFTGTASAQATVGTFFTLYAADGQVIGQVTVFTLTHLTWRDLNGNEQPDPGEFTAIVDQFRVTCP